MLLAVGASLSLPACYKDPPPDKPDPCPWPEVTTEGKHTLGFKINGKKWVPCVDLYAAVVGLQSIDTRLTESDGSNGFSLTGTRSLLSTGDSTIGGYGMHFRPLTIGIINIQELTSCSFNFSERKNGIFLDEWNMPETREGFHLEILKLDTANNIIASTFEAILLPKYGSDTLFITDGRFDIKYYPQ